MSIALEVLVEIGVGIKVDDREILEVPSKGAKDGVGDGMITAQRYGTLALLQHAVNRLLDGREAVALGELEIAGILVSAFGAYVDPEFGPHIGGIAAQRVADERRSGGRASLVGGVLVEGDAQQRGSPPRSFAIS
jgi:hypothetical protein